MTESTQYQASYACPSAKQKWIYIKTAEQRTIIQQYVIGTLAVDGWAVTFGTAMRGLGRCGPAHSPPNVTTHPVYQLFDVAL